MIINSFFTNNSLPATGLTPTIRIWEVTNISDVLVVNADPLTEIGDGFYKYMFLTYDDQKTYVYRVDGGMGLQNVDRFKVGVTQQVRIEDTQAAAIASSVWDQDLLIHTIAGSTGEALTQIKANATAIAISQSSMTTLITTILKYQRNRTRIDVTAKTLTVFDDDCSNVLQVFDLKDSAGNPSVIEVCERAPVGCP